MKLTTLPSTTRPRPWGLKRYAWYAVLAIVISACVQTEPALPVITSFTANPPASPSGEPVTLEWDVVGADSLTLLPGDVDVTHLSRIVVEPSKTTTYVLRAASPLGDSLAQVEVRVGPRPVIKSFGPAAGLVNGGLPSRLDWTVETASSLVLRGPGLGNGVPVDGMSSYLVPTVPLGAVYTLVATNDIGTVEEEALVGRSVPAVSLVIAGQSNAVGTNLMPAAATEFITAEEGVQMLGNDYVWKRAYEPLDDCADQLDAVSRDPCSPGGDGPGVSFGVSAGNWTNLVTTGEVFLIPAAKGGSSTTGWQPKQDRYDRTSLFGSAAYRARLADWERGAPLGYQAAGASYGAILWFQGETDTATLSLTNGFRSRTDIIFDAFQTEFGSTVIYTQLARRGPVSGDPDPTVRNLLYQRVREEQRRMETGARELDGSGSEVAEPSRFMVVSHDLPMHPDDGRHLSAEGQVELGRRMALAIREHMFGEVIDGTGPRLVEVRQASSTLIRVVADRPITAPSLPGPQAYSGYFGVFANGQALMVSSIERDPEDATAVLIRLQEPASGSVEVRYMPPPGILETFEGDVIRSASCSEPMPVTNACLPMPAFGVAADGVSLNALQLYTFDDPR